ncbi:MAG: 5-formyltetrahydrofolate cyclo-ligase [Pseudomonadota bacterium]
MNDWEQIAAWRKQQRAEMIARRMVLPEAERAAASHAVTELLIRGFAPLARQSIGFCWPYQGELDVRPAIEHWLKAGATAALPEILNGDLQFRAWHPDVRLAEGRYGIPVPQGSAVVQPDVLLMPLNAFDDAGFRLGYGGGYFDRVLLQPKRPLAIGIGYEFARLPTIYPQPHDVAMDFIVTEMGVYAVEGGRVKRV